MKRVSISLALATAVLSMAAAAQASPGARQLSTQPGEGADMKAQAAGRKRRCQRLRGQDLAPARRVMLVRRKTEDGTDLLGCVLPRGRVYVIASAEGMSTTVYDYELRQVAGATVLVDNYFSGEVAASLSTTVWNLRTGVSYLIASDCAMRYVPTPCDPATDSRARAAFVNSRGQAAAAVSSRASGLTTIVGFSARGARYVFDSGPSGRLPFSSLSMSGGALRWMNSGAIRSGALSP